MPNFLNGTILLGLLAGVIATAWARVREMLSQLEGVVLDRVTVTRYETVNAVTDYLYTKHRRPLGAKRFLDIAQVYTNAEEHKHLVYERFGRESGLYWFKRRPVYVVFASGQITLTVIRGTCKIENFLIEMARTQDLVYQNRYYHRHSRFYIKRVAGEDLFARGGNIDVTNNNSPAPERNRENQAQVVVPDEPPNPHELFNFLEGRLTAINMPTEAMRQGIKSKTLAALVLDDEATQFAETVERFLKSAHWYMSRNIPWTMGANLTGDPGVGKTSLIRAIAEDNGIPIISFDLSTMSNNELVRQWKTVCNDAPCIAVFEDLDNVFRGRENTKAKDNPRAVTFDTFLNCLDGLDVAHGVIKIATYNDATAIDPALGVRSTHEGSVSSRPGRFDVTLEIPKYLSTEGRRKIATQILGDYPWEIEPMVEASKERTAAQIQYVATQLALDFYWGRRTPPKDMLVAAPSTTG